ncbi:MAG: HNH endonuclease signature motif containing protein, partial [Phycisphaerae bacterium]
MPRKSAADKKKVPPHQRDDQRLFTGSELRALMAESNRRCCHPCCDSPYLSLQAHHMIYHSRGGITRRENGLLLCRNCHAMLHDGFMPPRLVFALKRPDASEGIMAEIELNDADALLERVEVVRHTPLTPAAKFTLLNDILVDANFLRSTTGKFIVLAHALVAKGAVLNDQTPPVRATLASTLAAMDNRRLWSQMLSSRAARYARKFGDDWLAARALHAIAVCYNARNRFSSSVAAHRRVLRFLGSRASSVRDCERAEMFRGRILREMGVCMAKHTERSTHATRRVGESLDMATAIGDPHDIDDA